MTKITPKNITIECRDEVRLSGKQYEPSNQVKAAIFIAPATGIKKRFYHSFAQYLAENGYGVITFDNNGIGDSLQGKVRDNKATLQSWGENDMYFVLETLKKAFPNTSYHLIGHSAGGQLVGLMENAMDITSMLNFASSSGRLKNMDFPYRFTAEFFMNIFIPFNNFILGFTNAKLLGMGEPLPKMVAQQWRAWCNEDGYVKTAFGKTVHTHLYDSLQMPSLWINATDDDIANDKNVVGMCQVFTKLSPVMLTLEPKVYGLTDIGHMKFFSKKNKALWTIALEWLERNR